MDECLGSLRGEFLLIGERLQGEFLEPDDVVVARGEAEAVGESGLRGVVEAVVEELGVVLLLLALVEELGPDVVVPLHLTANYYRSRLICLLTLILSVKLIAFNARSPAL